MDPDEGPCPFDPRERRAALTHPAPACAAGTPALPGIRLMSRSAKRQRDGFIGARVTPAEKQVAMEMAKPFGGIGVLIRTLVYCYKPPKSRVETELLARGLAEVAGLKGAVKDR